MECIAQCNDIRDLNRCTRQSSRELLPQYHDRFDVQIARSGLVQQQFALGRKVLIGYRVVKQQQHGVMGKEAEFIGRVVIAPYFCLYSAEPLAGGLEAGRIAGKVLRDHLFHVADPRLVLRVGRRH